MDENNLKEMKTRELIEEEKCLLLQGISDQERGLSELDSLRRSKSWQSLHEERRNLRLGILTRRHYGME